MCGRFSLGLDSNRLAREFAVDPRVLADPPWRPRYNIAPGQPVLIVLPPSPDGRWARWGWQAAWLAPSRRLVNLRRETLLNNRRFRDAWLRRRCLVPADGFYEWQRRPGQAAQPYRVAAGDGRPMALAGLWQTAPDGQGLEVTIVTAPAPAGLAAVHDRMPVILPVPLPATVPWVDLAAPEAALRLWLAHWQPPSDLVWYPVSPRVNRPDYDDAACLLPLSPPAALS